MGAAAMRRRVIVKVCRRCETEFTDAEWKTLKRIGFQPVLAGDDPKVEPGYTLELRNCGCGTTLAVELVQK